MNLWLAITLPIFTLAVSIYLFARLKLFSQEKPSGRILLFTSATLAVIAVVWHGLKPLPSYATWFLPGVYPILEWVHLGLVVLAVGLAVFGLFRYAGWWKNRLDEYRQREWAGAVLVSLYEQSREPKHLLEFLNSAVGSCLHDGVDAAAILFVNRTRRQFVLAASTGIAREETAKLEYYPLDRNPLGQSIELEEPLITDTFLFIDQAGTQTPSRFTASMVLPLVSGQEKVGVLLLLSQQSKVFARSHVKALQPVAGWLAERIRAARLQRELNTAKEQQEQTTQTQLELSSRLLRGLTASAASQPLHEFAETLIGFAGATDVQFCGVVSGSVTLLGHSQRGQTEWSENYRAALSNALDGSKPLVINQEGTSADGRSYLVASTVVFPVPSGNQKFALLLRREQTAISLSELELRYLAVFGSLAHTLLQYQQVQNLDSGRRKGFDAVARLLRGEVIPSVTQDAGYFARQFAQVLRSPSSIVTCTRTAEGFLVPAASVGIPLEKIGNFHFEPAESLVGATATSAELRFAEDRTEIRAVFDQLAIPNREVVNKLTANHGIPDMLAVCPLISGGSVHGFSLFMLYDLSQAERGEWRRLLTLASGLFSLRTSIGEMQSAPVRTGSATTQAAIEPVLLNELNNHFSIIIGNAELASKRDDITGEVRAYFTGIVEETERAATKVRRLGETKTEQSAQTAEIVSTGGDLNQALTTLLSGSRISDTLHMIAGRPREIFTKLSTLSPVQLANDKITQFASETVQRFASLAEDDDVITLSTYVQDGYAFLDISRHRKNFPPVEQVAGFGKYLLSAEAAKFRPADTFLKKVADGETWYAFDSYSAIPSYLSFKFPLKQNQKNQSAAKTVRVLAIDDQPIILDLISAMCISLGYSVRTAPTGEEGIRLAEKEAFDMVLTDLAMPGISGLETAKRIHEISPKMPIVLVTGWEASVSGTDLATAGIARVLYKPFRIEQLTELIQSFVENRSFV